MPEGQVLEFSAVTKRFGSVTAVDAFTARVAPGRVTGFLGPNGAGKTTTLRILLGLVRSSGGSATIGGLPYSKLAHPLQTVGAVLEASSFHPGRTGANHLKVYARAAGLPNSRVDEALGLVGLADVAGRKVGGYSLGMRQRLGLAYALIGDPGVLVLDEPANGLDPEGIRWMRGLLRDLARQGRTVLVSSHLLTEVQQTVDSLLIISAGRLVFQGGLEELSDPSESATVVDSPDRAGLAAALAAQSVEVEVLRSGLTVRGLDPAEVGRIAADAGIALSSLQRRGPALEEVFLDLVNGARVHPSAGGVGFRGAALGAAGVAGAVALTGPVEAEEAPVEPVDVDAEPEVAATDAVSEVAVADAEPEVAVADAEPEVAVADAVDEVAAADAVAAPVEAESDAPDDEPEDAVDVETEPAPTAEASEATDDAEVVEEVANTPAPAAFVVASTGIIDIIPADAEAAADAETEAEAEPDAEADADAEAIGDAEGRHPSPFESGEEAEHFDSATAEWASVESEEDRDVEPSDAVEAPPVDPDRPWEQYVKTDSDVEADRFFAAFSEETPDDGRDADEARTESDALPVSELETPKPEDLGAPPPDWHAQPEPLAEEPNADDAEGGESR